MKPQDLTLEALEAFNESLRVSGHEGIELYALSAAISAAVNKNNQTRVRSLDTTHRLFLEGARQNPAPTGGFDIWWASMRHELASQSPGAYTDLPWFREVTRRAYNCGFADATQVAKDIFDQPPDDTTNFCSCEMCIKDIPSGHNRDGRHEPRG